MAVLLYTHLVQDYECQKTGVCCREKWDLPFDEFEKHKLITWLEHKNKWDTRDRIASLSPKEDDSYAIPRQKNGDCYFLERGLCVIRVEGGLNYRPYMCSSYPCVAMSTPAGIICSLQFSCPSASRLLLSSSDFKIKTIQGEPIIPNVLEVSLPVYKYTMKGRQVEPVDWWFHLLNGVKFFQDLRGASLDQRLLELVSMLSERDICLTSDTFVWNEHLDAMPLPQISEPFIRLGGIFEILTGLWGSAEVSFYQLSPIKTLPDTELLFHRYLFERLLAPFYLYDQFSMEKLSSFILLLYGRLKLELARGTPIEEVVRRVDTLFVNDAFARVVSDSEITVEAAAFIGLNSM